MPASATTKNLKNPKQTAPGEGAVGPPGDSGIFIYVLLRCPRPAWILYGLLSKHRENISHKLWKIPDRGWQAVKVIVTGGSGFIGTHTVECLIRRGHEPYIADLRRPARTDVPYSLCSILDSGKLHRLWKQVKPDAVIHLATQVSVSASMADPLDDVRRNAEGTLRVLEACRAHGTPRIVTASSAAVYGAPLSLPVDETHPLRPVSPYGCSKLCMEAYVQTYARMAGIGYAILRYANVYGPGQRVHGESGVAAIFADLMHRGMTPVIHGTGEQTRDFVYVADVANANVTAAEREDSAIVNVSTGRQTSVAELAGLLQRFFGTGRGFGYAAPREGDIARSALNPGKIERLWGWRAEVGIEEGIRRTAAYYSGKPKGS